MNQKDEELDLIKQVVSLEVMQGQSMLVLKEIKDDLKALTLEYRNYRIDIGKRLESVERYQERMEKYELEDKIKEINFRLSQAERFHSQMRTGWIIVAGIGAIVYNIFVDDIKKWFH